MHREGILVLLESRVMFGVLGLIYPLLKEASVTQSLAGATKDGAVGQAYHTVEHVNGLDITDITAAIP